MSDTRKKIIMVDDNSAVLEMGKELLRHSYDVYPLPSAETMFKALEKITPDLFLLDIKMPDISGFGLIEQLKADSRFAKIPVIFLTGSYSRDTESKGRSLGAVDYITKPFRNPDFIECIERHLQDAEEANKPVILAIDDSYDTLKAVYAVLQDKYKVYTLSKPKKLTELLQKIKPALFLLDYKMPELTGFDLIPIIREFNRHKDTPIIFLTSDATMDRLTAAVGLGACDYVIKPFKAEVLRDKIERHI